MWCVTAAMSEAGLLINPGGMMDIAIYGGMELIVGLCNVIKVFVAHTPR